MQPQLAAIQYVAKGDERNPRQLQVLLPPSAEVAGGQRVWLKHVAGETLLERLKQKRYEATLSPGEGPAFGTVSTRHRQCAPGLTRALACACPRSDGMVYMQNKIPEVCGNSYRLNFHGRVKVRGTLRSDGA